MKVFILLSSLFLVGYPQNPECMQSILDIVYVLDSSGSIGPTNFNIAKDTLSLMVGNLNVDPGKIHIGLINYSCKSFFFQQKKIII